MPAPPEGHARQCQARSRVTGRRCRRWALRGRRTCQFHGGRSGGISHRRKKLAGFYSKYLGPKLSERVAELMAKTHDEQVSLYEELAVARATACEAMALAQPLFDPEKSSELKPETRALMVQTLNQAMNNVKELVLAASRIEKDAEDKVSIKVVNLVVQQIVMTINEVCGTDNVQLCDAIAKAIDERVRLPINDKMNPVIKVNLV